LAEPQFTYESHTALRHAAREAERWGDPLVGADHLLLALLRGRETGADRVLAHFRVERSPLIERLERYLSWADHEAYLEIRKLHGRKADDPQLGHLLPRLGRVLDLAAEEARHHGRPAIGTEHLLYGVVSEAGSLGSWLLQRAGPHPELLRADLAARLPEGVRSGGVWVAASHSAIHAEGAVKGLGLLGLCWLTLALSLLIGIVEQVLDPRLWPAFVRFVWFAGAALSSLRAGLRRERRAWPRMQALLFVASAGAAGLVVAALTGLVPSLGRDRGPLEFYLLATGTLALTLFRHRAEFGVGQREGWRVLWREGKWYLIVSGVLELAALLGVMLRG
jgi:hypothetical protein